MITAPRRVVLTKVEGRTVVPTEATRVDRDPWRPPFTTRHPFIPLLMGGKLIDNYASRHWALARMCGMWLDGQLYEDAIWRYILPKSEQRPVVRPPRASDILRLRGRDLADWPPIGQPCVGDVLLARANRYPDGELFPTASDAFRPQAKAPGRKHSLEIYRFGW